MTFFSLAKVEVLAIQAQVAKDEKNSVVSPLFETVHFPTAPIQLAFLICVTGGPHCCLYIRSSLP